MMFPGHFTLIDKINFLQRKILVNSILYYEHNKNFISDHHYDDCCKELVNLQVEYGPRFVSDSTYGYVFWDFDGSTGFHLYSRLELSDRYWLDMIINIKLDRMEG